MFVDLLKAFFFTGGSILFSSLAGLKTDRFVASSINTFMDFVTNEYACCAQDRHDYL